MAGCDYCGEMHSGLYRCEAQHQAEASPNKGGSWNARWGEERRRYRADMRDYIAERRQAKSASL